MRVESLEYFYWVWRASQSGGRTTFQRRAATEAGAVPDGRRSRKYCVELHDDLTENPKGTILFESVLSFKSLAREGEGLIMFFYEILNVVLLCWNRSSPHSFQASAKEYEGIRLNCSILTGSRVNLSTLRRLCSLFL